MAGRPTVRFDFPGAGVFPTRDDFLRLAEHGNVVPVCRAVLADTETPVSAFRKLGGRHAFLLESVEGGETVARYTYMGRDPFLILRYRLPPESGSGASAPSGIGYAEIAEGGR